MIRNYIKIAWRNLLKNRENSFVHIFGLTIGLTGCILIGLFVMDELKYDIFHPDGDRTYRIYTERGGESDGALWASSSPAFQPRLKADFPEVQEAFRLFRIRSKQLFESNGKSYLEDGGLFAEPPVLKFFHLPLLHGDPSTALNEINSIILTQRLAEKYFGQTNPVGKTIKINRRDRVVTGVLEPLPSHFHLDFNFLVSFENLLESVSEERINSWVWQDFYNYVHFYPGTDVERFSDKLKTYTEENAHPVTKEFNFYYYPNLQKLKDIHLHSARFRNELAIRGDFQYVLALGIIGVFLLFIACINFINLTTARAMRRAKEVGVRKATGAMRSQLAIQFILEAIMIVGISTLLAAQLATTLTPFLNQFSDKAIAFDWYSSFGIMSALLGITLITGLFAGAYPAFILSGFKPVDALKGIRFNTGGHVNWMRKGLIVIQFAISVILIISVLIIFQQVEYVRDKNLGFHKEQLLHFPMRSSLYNNFESTKNEFLKVPGVISASTCFGIPGDIVAGDDIIVPGENRQSQSARIFAVDFEFIETMGMEIIAGRDFSKDIRTDSSEAFVLNETALVNLGLADSPEEAIGKNLEWVGWDEDQTIKKGRVIGVVKDFHYTSLKEEVQTSVLHIYPDSYWKLALRVNDEQLDKTIAGIEKTWNEFNTGYPIDYQFVDEGFGTMYKAEEKLNTLIWIFTLLAIVISCIGAFGLAAYSAEQRRKEIGIRKVLGASTHGIVALLSKEMFSLVLMAFLIASPIAWYVMSRWLENFAYTIKLNIWIFFFAGIIACFTALLTVSFHSIKAALMNPVTSIRTE